MKHFKSRENCFNKNSKMLKQIFGASNCFNKWKILGDKTVASEAMFEAFLLFLWLLQHHRAMSAPSASIYLPSPRYPVTALTITSGPALQKPGCGFILQPAGGCCCAVQPLFFIPPYAKARARIYPPGGTGHSFGTYDGLGSSSLRNM